jgi:excisionase family DNA binding protein
MQEPHDASASEELAAQLGMKVREMLLPTLQQISESLDHLRLDRRSPAVRSDEANPSRSGYVTIERAAEITTISDSHLRRVIRSGELPASNIGTAARPTWRISRKDLDDWMQRKQGESPKLPPRSALDDLIRRHLPGL